MSLKKSLISLKTSLIILRLSVALVFFLHALVRVVNSSIPSFSEFLKSKGLPAPTLLVWLITLFELTGSIALAFGIFTKWLSIGFILLLMIGNFLIHISFGWFVGEHGTGGVEYSFILIVCLLVIYVNSNKSASINRTIE